MAKGGMYDVGYGKPPRNSRFKKGQSGNPSGKKTARRTLDDDLVDVLSKIVTVNENGRPVKMTIQRLMLKVAATKAAKGDAAAFKRLTELVARAPAPLGAAADELTDNDEAIIADFRRRVLRDQEG